MAWSQVSKFKNMVIAVNGVTVYEGDLQVPLLPTDIFNRAASALGNGSQTISSSDFVFMYRYYDPPNITWDSYDAMVLTAGPYSDSDSLFDLVNNVGDVITIYNKTIGTQNALRFRFASNSGGYRSFYFGIISNGVLYEDGTNAALQTYRSSSEYRIGYWGIIFDPDLRKAMVWNSRSVIHIPPRSGDIAGFQYTPHYNASQTVAMYGLYSAFAEYDGGGGGGGSDPYEAGGYSGEGGGENATFDLTSDDVDVPSLPTISASGAGLLTLYQVSLQNMHDFASYLWSPLFDVDTLKKLFNDPMDAIISLGMLPFTPTGGTVSNIFIGESDSGVSASRLGSQYYELDMGSLTLDTFYDSALDLNPYTKVDLYLPYCGTVSINPDEFDGKSIHVVYHVDILTGACVVFVEDGSRVLVQSQGNILTAIPFTSKDFKSIFGAVLGDAAAAGAALFALPTGGISAAAAVGIVGGTAMNSVNSKLNMPHGGQCASTAGFLSAQKPYLIITRPAQCLPEDNAAYQGYPAYITATVGDLTGFIKISEAHFDGFTCTDGELKEIDRLLKEGVYVQ